MLHAVKFEWTQLVQIQFLFLLSNTNIMCVNVQILSLTEVERADLFSGQHCACVMSSLLDFCAEIV